jgi:hypothetical protein
LSDGVILSDYTYLLPFLVPYPVHAYASSSVHASFETESQRRLEKTMTRKSKPFLVYSWLHSFMRFPAELKGTEKGERPNSNVGRAKATQITPAAQNSTITKTLHNTASGIC